MINVSIPLTTSLQTKNYKLHSLIIHVGLTTNSGHYYTIVRQDHLGNFKKCIINFNVITVFKIRSSSLNKWIILNDDKKVTETTWENIISLTETENTPYILGYEEI